MGIESEPTGHLSTDPKVYLWRAGVIIIGLLILVLQLWATTNYVPRAEYERDRGRTTAEKEENNKTLLTINNTLIRIDEKMKGDDARDRELTDHEKRIQAAERTLERLTYGKAP